MDSSSQRQNDWLKPLTQNDYYQSFRTHVIGERAAVAPDIIEDDFIIFGQNKELAIYIYKTKASCGMEYISNAIEICMKGLLYVNTSSDISTSYSATEELIVDDWPLPSSYCNIYNVALNTKQISDEIQSQTKNTRFEMNNSFHKESDPITKKRKRSLETDVSGDKKKLEEIDIESLLYKVLSKEIIPDKILIYGLVSLVFTNHIPFSIIPLHCKDKRNVLENILNSGKMEYMLQGQISELSSIGLVRMYRDIIENEWRSIPHVLTIETYFNNKNEIILGNEEENEHIHSTIFTLYEQTIQTQSEDSSKVIPPFYVKCKNRPLSGPSSYTLLLRSIFLYIMSHFPQQPPSSTCVFHGKIEHNILQTLIDTNFVIDILTPAITYKSNQTTVSDVLKYYLVSLENISGASLALSTVSQSSLAGILTGQEDTFIVERIFKEMKSENRKEEIRVYLQTFMTPLSTFLLIDKTNGRFTVPIVYQDSLRTLFLGIKCVDKTSNHIIILAREAHLGQDDKTICDFALDEHVTAGIELKGDKKLIASLMLESTNKLVTLVHMIKKLCNDNIGTRILTEYISIGDHTDFFSHVFYSINDNEEIELHEVDLDVVREQIVVFAIEQLYKANHSFVKAKYVHEDNINNYIVFIDDMYHIYPKEDEDTAKQLKEHQFLFANTPNTNVAYVLKWLLSSHLTDKFLNITLQLNPKIQQFVSSVQEYMRNDTHFCTIILTVIHDVISALPSALLVSSGETFQLLLQYVAHNNIKEQLDTYDSNIKTSLIFCLEENLGYIFLQKESGTLYFLDKDTLMPDVGKISSLNILHKNNVNRLESWEIFQSYSKELQQLYWRNVIRTNFDIFSEFINGPYFNIGLMSSYGVEDTKLLDYGKTKVIDILTTLIKETPLGAIGNLYPIVSKTIDNTVYKTVYFSQITYMCLSKENKPVFVISKGNKANIADILLLHYLTKQEVGFGFAFIKRNIDTVYKLAMLTDNSEKTNAFYSLKTVQDVLDFFKPMYGNHIYTQELNDVFLRDVEMTVDQFHTSYIKETSFLTQLNIWRHRWKNIFNNNYNLLPAMLRHINCLTTDIINLKSHISVNYKEPVNNVLQYNVFKYDIVETIHLNENCLTFVLNKPSEVMSALNLKEH
jgi:hypothetical protein